MLIQILEQVLNGLLAGAYYLLIALGLSLIFSLGGLVNLAHGAFYAIGAYAAVKLAGHLGFGGVLVAAPMLVALLGIVIERFLFRRFYRQDPALGLGWPAHVSQRAAWLRAGQSRTASRCRDNPPTIPYSGARHVRAAARHRARVARARPR